MHKTIVSIFFCLFMNQVLFAQLGFQKQTKLLIAIYWKWTVQSFPENMNKLKVY